MIKYRYTEDIMKNRRNKIGYGLLSLALALAFPLNALADEITDGHNENETADTLINEEDINLQELKGE